MSFVSFLLLASYIFILMNFVLSTCFKFGSFKFSFFPLVFSIRLILFARLLNCGNFRVLDLFLLLVLVFLCFGCCFNILGLLIWISLFVCCQIALISRVSLS